MRKALAISAMLLFTALAFRGAAVPRQSTSAPASAIAPSSLIAHPAGRPEVRLDGTWRVIVDPYEIGLSKHFSENAKPKDKQDLVEYDFDASGTLKVPGDWNSQREELFFYEGPVWYKKSFAYHRTEGRRVFLQFGAANYRARVYLNGELIGEHEGGFTPFNFEVTSKVRDSENLLVVEVNNQRLKEGVPAPTTDFWNYGGLTRGVTLFDVPETFIQDYFIQLARGSRDEISGWVQLNGPSAAQQLTLEIPEARLRQAITTDAQGRAAFRFPAKLELWSPDHPKLYDVKISGASDAVTDQIGFRSIETRGTQILLNGKPILLRGISMHEEAPFRGGRAFSPEDDAILLGWARELGCNFVRLAHYPHNQAMIRLADRLGLLVWEEIPVYWDIAWENPAALESARGQLRDVIARDHNRAAVIFWSVANETPVKPERLEFLKRLLEDARASDATRLVTAALNHVETPSPGTKQLVDPLSAFVDVIGLNEYMGWYGKDHPEDCDHTRWIVPEDKPLVVSEFGGDAPAGNHGDAAARWTEEYQASIYEHQIPMLRRIPSFAGMSPWLLMDFHSPRRLLPGVQDYLNRKGLVSDRGQRKMAFFVLQKFYGELAQSSAH